jgi:phosphonoacetate hydrolase
MTSCTPEIRLIGVRYRWPERPVVVVCNDGGDPDYLDRTLEDGIVPNIARFMRMGFSAIAECVIPSVTCSNNVSIMTGAPPSLHALNDTYAARAARGGLRNFHIFAFAINGVVI